MEPCIHVWSIINSSVLRGTPHRPQAGTAALAAIIAAGLALASCEKSADPAPTVATAPAQVADATSKAGAIDYGPLGEPETTDTTDIDPKFDSYSPQKKLAMFHEIERNPHQGGDDHVMTWDQIDEQTAFQRALFYAALKKAPELITADDWRTERNNEKSLIQSSCGNAGSPGVRYQLDKKVCDKYPTAN